MRNLYATLAEYKDFARARGQDFKDDPADDGVIMRLLESASRYMDEWGADKVVSIGHNDWQ